MITFLMIWKKTTKQKQISVNADFNAEDAEICLLKSLFEYDVKNFVRQH